jgi:peptidylprolyl isomerase
MEQGRDSRWLILGVFALLAAGVVAAVLIGRSGGGGSKKEGSCQKPPGPVATSAKKTKPTVEVPDCSPPETLVVNELERGTGAEAKSGDKVSVQYVGVNFEDGEEFDSSWSRGEPFSFTLGGGEVIQGWDQGVEGMEVGGRRELIIPPDLAYGEAGSPPSIGPDETLVFVIDLVAVK